MQRNSLRADNCPTHKTSVSDVSCRCFNARLKKSPNDTPASADRWRVNEVYFSIPSHSRQFFPSQQELEADSSEAPYSARDNNLAHYLRNARNNTPNQTAEQFFNREDDSLDTNLIFDIMNLIFRNSKADNEH